MLYDERLDSIMARARRFGGRAAIICHDRTVTFEELDELVGRMASALVRRDVGAGDVVSIYGSIGWQWVVAYHAVARVGAIINPINALLTPDEVAYIVTDCRAKVIFSDRSRLVTLERAVNSLPLQHRIAFEDLDGLIATSEMLAATARGQSSDISTICYTSGTTGRPKGAMLSHRAVIMNAGLTAVMHGRNTDDIIVTSLPFAHVYGNVVMNSALIVGATLVTLPAFDPVQTLEAIETYQATMFEGVPTMYLRMLENKAELGGDFTSLRMCTVGGQSMPVDKMEAVESVLGCPLIELWGMTEIAGLGTTFPWTGPSELGSIGLPLPTMHARIVDQDGLPVRGHSQSGELQIRGPSVMDGYLGNPAATREVLSEDGWLSTGDIAQIDELGHIFVMDRQKDVILVSGNNVYPAELERVISGLPGVVMVGVGRDSHPTKGEIPHAYVVLERDSTITAEVILAHCRKHLAPYKLPKAVTFAEDLPKTSSGKIMRRALCK